MASLLAGHFFYFVLPSFTVRSQTMLFQRQTIVIIAEAVTSLEPSEFYLRDCFKVASLYTKEVPSFDGMTKFDLSKASYYSMGIADLTLLINSNRSLSKFAVIAVGQLPLNASTSSLAGSM